MSALNPSQPQDMLCHGKLQSSLNLMDQLSKHQQIKLFIHLINQTDHFHSN